MRQRFELVFLLQLEPCDVVPHLDQSEWQQDGEQGNDDDYGIDLSDLSVGPAWQT
ncbi:MAG: hypothetical protein M3360_07935 [Actinomycetota bacterium]|nr:hypothetical protein [Actinomycetota bacterium]